MTSIPRDDNFNVALFGISSVDGITPVALTANPVTGALVIDGTSLYGSLDPRYVNITGDTMTGALTITPLTYPLLALGSSATFTWSQVGGAGVGWNNEDTVRSLAVYNGKLYIGVEGSTSIKGAVWEWDGTTYTQIASNNNPFPGSSYSTIQCMAVYNGKLYFGTGSATNSDDIWTYDGTDVVRVGGNGINGSWSGFSAIQSITVGNGKLYVGLNDGSAAKAAAIWAYNGTSWTKVGGDGVNSSWATGTYDSIASLAFYKSQLYAGMGGTRNFDAIVWKFDGTTWTLIGGGGVNNSWSLTNVDDCFWLAVYNDKLYTTIGGITNSIEVWDWNGTTWSQTGTDTNNFGGGHDFSPTVGIHNGKLVIGLNGSNGVGDAYSYDGVSWVKLNASGAWTPATYNSLYSIASFNGKLYVGLGTGTNQGILWELNDSTLTNFSKNASGIGIGDALFIGHNNYVGINKNVPQAALDIDGNLKVSENLLNTVGHQVGIGTNTPLGKLHVQVAAEPVISSKYSSYFANFAVNSTIDGINKYGVYIISTGTFTGSSGTSTNNYGLYVDTVSGADNNIGAYFAGNVGIGITVPDFLLHAKVNDTSLITQKLEQASTGDVALQFVLTGVQAFSMGIDNSDSDKFKISTSSSDVGASTLLTITTTGNVGIGTTTLVAGGGLTIAPTARTSGTPSLLTVTAPADTTLTIAEFNDVNFNLSRTANFAAGGGTIATQRSVLMQGTTYTATTNAVTLTTAATLAVTPPTAGSNVTITNGYSIFATGKSMFGPNAANGGQATLHIDTNNTPTTSSSAITVSLLVSNNLSINASGQTGNVYNLNFNALNIGATGSPTIPLGANIRSTPLTTSSGALVTKNYAFMADSDGDLIIRNTASSQHAGFAVNPYSIQLTATTQITSTPAVAGVYIDQLTVKQQAGATTVDNAASLYIVGPPIAGTSVTLTNNYALWIDSGATRLDGDVTVNGSTAPVGRLLLPMGEVSYFNTTGTAVAITTVSDGSTNMVVVAPTTTLNNDREFDNGGANNGRLRYTGTTTKTFHVACTISFAADSANDVFVIGIAKNGTVISSSKVLTRIINANDTVSTALHVMVSLANNDYLELYVGNTTDADDFVIKTLTLFAVGM